MKTDDQKPTLYLLSGKEAMTAEGIAALYEKLTGKHTTPQEMDECRARLLAAKERQQTANPDKADTDCQ